MEPFIGGGWNMVDSRNATPNNTSIIICCAGMGTRLGIGSTKALVDICGEPLILRQLKLLEDYDDIRIKVSKGYYVCL